MLFSNLLPGNRTPLFMRKVLLILFFLSISSQLYAATCKVKDNQKIKEIVAPHAIEYSRENSGNRIDSVLANRKTINLFRAWRSWELGSKDYGLGWGVQTVSPPTSTHLSLREIYWAYTYPDQNYSGQIGMEKFALKSKWGDKAWQEYGRTLNVDYTHPDFLDYITQLVKSRTEGMDGVIFDLWRNDNHSYYGGKSSSTVKKYRYKIAKSIREEMGKDFIILGNINWEKQKDTHQFINGVFLEFWKKTRSGYTCKQIKDIASIIEFHDKNLSYPRLVAVNVWKIAKNPPKEKEKELLKKIFAKEVDIKKFDKNYWIKNYRSSPENIKFAKLFTAMAMVIPENGYILYGDNNSDHPEHDHYHEIYDFYKIDLGKPTSLKTEIVDGLAFKLHEKGVIAYNLTKNNYLIKFDKKEVLVKSFEGVFEKF